MLRLNVTARSGLWLSSGLGRPLATVLPPGARTLYWGADGAPPHALRVLTTTSGAPGGGGEPRLEATAPMSETVDAMAFGEPSAAARKKAASSSSHALQAVAEPTSSPGSGGRVRHVVASVVDWRTSRAYVALSGRPGGEGGCCPLLQLALPSMATLHAMSPHSVQPDAATSCMALAGDASETAAPADWLHVLRSSHEGKRGELLVLSLPEMQPTHSLSFATPSAVGGAYYDARSGFLYLLCSAPAPRLLRIMMKGGEPTGPPGLTDTLPLPSWVASAPLLVPFPHARVLLFFSAPNATTAVASHASTNAPLLPSHVTPPPLQVCRVRLGSPPPLQASASSCTQLRGQYSLESVRAAVADEAAGVAYVGCQSGKLLRLRLSPLRVEEALTPVGRAPVASLAFRAEDAALWLAAEGGELVQLSTRAPPAGATSPPPALPAAWSRLTASLLLKGGHDASDKADDGASVAATSPPSPSPSPRRMILPQASGAPGAPSSKRMVWVYPKLGLMPALLLTLLGGMVGAAIGSRLYRLLRACWPGKRQSPGLAALP